jgi:hypothetical protein
MFSRKRNSVAWRTADKRFFSADVTVDEASRGDATKIIAKAS